MCSKCFKRRLYKKRYTMYIALNTTITLTLTMTPVNRVV